MTRADTVIVYSLPLAKDALLSPTILRPTVRRVSAHAQLRYALLCYLRMRQDNALLHAAMLVQIQSLCARSRSPKMPCIRLLVNRTGLASYRSYADTDDPRQLAAIALGRTSVR